MATKHRRRALAIVVLTATATVLAPATSAQALLTSCSRGWQWIDHHKYAFSSCASGTGEQRVGIIYLDKNGDYTRTSYGPWVGKKELSLKENVAYVGEHASDSLLISRRP